MKTLEKFISDYLGKSKGYPDDNQYFGECLSIVKLYIKECFGIDPPPSGTNSAYGYWTNFPSPLGTKFEKVVNTDTLVPEEGWIAIWQPWASNQYGHIAIVAKGSTTGTLKNYAQNWTSRTFQLESNRYTNVVGFLKPKQLPVEENMNEQEKLMLDFIRVNQITEGQLREGYGYVKDGTVANQSKEIEALKKLSQDLAERVAVLESENKDQLKAINEKNKLINELQSIKKIDDYSVEEVLRLLINKILKK